MTCEFMLAGAQSRKIIDHLNRQRGPPILEGVEIAWWHLQLLIAGCCCTRRACITKLCMKITAPPTGEQHAKKGACKDIIGIGMTKPGR